MTTHPAQIPLIAALPATVPFVGPEALERRRAARFLARLGANESAFGPSPNVVAAIGDSARDIWMYGDPDNYDLKNALAAHLGVGHENVAVGEGIDGLLSLIARIYVQQGTPVVTSLGAYPTFNYHVAGFGGRLVSAPYENNRENLNALLEAVHRENAPLAYLSNPDNPMGTWWEGPEILRFIEALPQTTMLILDEAYGETAPESAIPPFDASRPNVLRMRTFSKAYGLAGIRCGYAVGEAGIIRSFDKIRNHFGVNRLAQNAGVAALADQVYLQTALSRIGAGREKISAIARASGLNPIPSATNFVAIDCGEDGDFAQKILQHLLTRGVFIRKPMTPGLDHFIRVSVGLDHELAILGEELPGAIAAARGK